jgi:hypothetical protein
MNKSQVKLFADRFSKLMAAEAVVKSTRTYSRRVLKTG